MQWLWDLSLVRFLDFYLVILFVASVIRRFDFYRSAVRLATSFPGRWPKLFKLLNQHRTLILTWQTAFPAILVLLLAVVQLLASRAIWPDAGRPPHGLTIGKLNQWWWAAAIITVTGLAMFAVDIYFLIVIGIIDRPALEKQFDEAEYWLNSRTAHVVRFFTFGWVNPRRMVSDEVQKGLSMMGEMLHSSLWWTVSQLGLRLAFGLSIWLTWAYSLTV